MRNVVRLAIGGLSLSAAGLIGYLMPWEGWSDVAIIPVAGDVWTVGPGLTRRPDGTPVRQGDRVTHQQGMARMLTEVNRFENGLEQCVKVPLAQNEFDALVSLAYNIGAGAVCNSTLMVRLNEEDYEAACQHFSDFICGPATAETADARCTHKGANGFIKYGKVFQGLVNRREAERKLCLGMT